MKLYPGRFALCLCVCLTADQSQAANPLPYQNPGLAVEARLQDLLPLDAAGGVFILLGPEGGFTAEEVDAARAEGWRTVSLGRRILRAETASLAAAAIIQHLLGAM